VFSDIMMSAGSLGQTSFAFDASGEEVDRILAEAGAVAEQRMSDSFPDVPIGSYSSSSSSSSLRTSAGEHQQ
jgi:division protein CdvB (Snf7/Vps24/ESCRT-III family)